MLEMSSEHDALKMRLRTLEEAAKRDQVQINTLQVECESYKRQLNASVTARLSEKEAATKNEALIESLQTEVASLQFQLTTCGGNNLMLPKLHSVPNHGSNL